MTGDSVPPRLQHRRGRDVVIQEAIDDLVRHRGELSPDELRRRLVRRLADRGVVGLPEPWLDAVSTALGHGNPYVVSPFTLDTADVPAPEDPVRDEVID
ncbi:hypothetical protein KMZ32_03710 [Phycicoccus sp. MAQZ13P-2]|uniref:hypothetical protein n=1 Tax=Phycicoccus mangrovi TaxID=2840470 RepID=UPI001C0003A0|nr:hypothetical protein [Phycicoccus mangrovi]MBT9254616.1 hypothetical protein [Phycicoccus mangrovi]MBT9273179.1 hypothetical protein [Phycicoccus mangrovi]